MCCFGYCIYLCCRKTPEDTKVAPQARPGESLNKLDGATIDPTLELQSMDDDDSRTNQFPRSASQFNAFASAVSLGGLNSEVTGSRIHRIPKE